MLIVLTQTIAGLFFCGAGIYAGYLYLAALDEGNNFLLLGGTIISFCIGVYFLFKAGRAGENVVLKGSIKELQNQHNQHPELNAQTILERNNALSDEWGKTLDQRNKLKILQIAANAEKSK